MAKTEEYKILVTADTRKATNNLKGITAGMKALGVVAAAGVFLKLGKEIIDASKQMQTYRNQLKLITKDHDDLNRLMGLLTQASIENRASFGATVELFQKLAITTKDLNKTEEQLLNVTSKLSQALAVAGADAGTTNGVIRQFGQAMASGTVRGDEFNSIVEGLGPALAIMAEESGLNVGTLRKLSQSGGLTAEVLFNMLENSTALSGAFNQMSVTTEQLETQLGDSYTAFLDNSTITGIYDTGLKALIRTLDKISGREGAIANMSTAELLATEQVAAALEEMEKRYKEAIGAVRGIKQALSEEDRALLQHIDTLKEKLKTQEADAEATRKDKEAKDANNKAIRDLIGSTLDLATAYQTIDLTKFMTQEEKLAHELDKVQKNMSELLEAQLELALSDLNTADAVAKLEGAYKNLGIQEAFLIEQHKKLADANKKANDEAHKAAMLAKQQDVLTYLNIKSSVELSKQHSDAQRALIDKLNTIKTITEAEFDGAINGIEALHLKEAAERKYNADLKRFSDERIELARNEEAQKMKDFIDAQSKKREQILLTRTYELVQQGKTADQAKSIAEFENKTNQEKAQFAIGQAKDAFQALGQFNKQAFQAYKAFAIAQAIQNTYLGATKAMASYPPPFNFIAAAAVVAGGLAQVASIRNQNYSGRQFGGPVTGGTPYMVGEDGPELVVPQGNATVIPNNKLGMNSGTTNVNFTINAVDAEGIDEILVSRRGLITNIIREASETNGVRSAF